MGSNRWQMNLKKSGCSAAISKESTQKWEYLAKQIQSLHNYARNLMKTSALWDFWCSQHLFEAESAEVHQNENLPSCREMLSQPQKFC